MSVIVVTKTADDTAGSMSKRSSVTGTNMPASPATRLLMSIADAITAPSSGLPKMSAVPAPIRMPSDRPLTVAMRNSRRIMRIVFDAVS